tara:strand:+ start:196066 stop:196863 length:798 start_codon:yes stop_codon:yes gene_type:complete
MAKSAKSKRKPQPGRGSGRSPQKPAHLKDSTGQSAAPRNACLDTLRGLAIVLMVIDHVADLLLDISIRDSNVRLGTRLAMPLFCVLMGYFLKIESRHRFRRLLEVIAASALANLVFYPRYGVLEILASLVVAALLFKATGRWFVLMVLALFLYPWDPLAAWFDFPPTIVISFVAQGMILRRLGIKAALASGILLSSGAIWMYQMNPLGVNYKLCLFILPATLLLYLGDRLPEKRIATLQWIGKYPLTIYVAQYYAISLAAELLQR